MSTAVMLSEARRAILRSVLSPFAGKIDRVAIFGSRATGRARENSDIDLVVYGRLEQGDVDRLWTMFDESALSVPVDIVAYDLTSYPPFRQHIDRVAVTLFTNSDLVASPATQR